MRKIITVCLLLISLTIFGQETKTLTGQATEIIKDNFNVSETLNQVNTVKDLFIHYTKEVAEGSKSLVSNGIQLVEKAVDLLYTESTIIVTQYIIYTSISYAIPIILGILLIIYLPLYIKKRFSMDADKAEAYNLQVEKDNSESQFYKECKKISYLGVYYKNKLTLFTSTILSYLGYGIGIYLVVTNLMPFIKVTFFSKLYLIELLLKYI